MQKNSDYAISKRDYYADFFIVPIVALIALGWLAYFHTVAREALASSIMVGALTWTFAEYMIHRFIFHGVEPFKHEHHLHHVDPTEYIGVSSWKTPAIFAGLGFVLPMVFGPSVGVGLFVGLLAGYYVYITVHDRFHHSGVRDLNSVLGSLYWNHAWHHRSIRANFGVSSPLWDLVFGTYVKPPILFRTVK